MTIQPKYRLGDSVSFIVPDLPGGNIGRRRRGIVQEIRAIVRPMGKSEYVSLIEYRIEMEAPPHSPVLLMEEKLTLELKSRYRRVQEAKAGQLEHRKTQPLLRALNEALTGYEKAVQSFNDWIPENQHTPEHDPERRQVVTHRNRIKRLRAFLENPSRETPENPPGNPPETTRRKADREAKMKGRDKVQPR